LQDRQIPIFFADYFLRHIVRDTPGADLWPVSVAAAEVVAWGGTWRPRVCRESQGQEKGHTHGHSRGSHLRRLLVPHTGE